MADETVDTPQTEDPEPEGVVEVDVAAAGMKQKMVPVSVLPAERQRIRAAELSKREAIQRELDTERQKNAQLAGDLQAVRPHIEHLQKHPELLKAGESPEIAAVSDDEAEAYAKDFELYTANGLDVARAKRMIVRENKRVDAASQRAAQAAVAPLAQSTAANQSMAFKAWAMNQRGADGALLADPSIIDEVWNEVPAELTADPRVARERLEVAIGKTLLAGKRPAAPLQREPTFSESPGGFRERAYEMTPMERAIQQNQGIPEKEWQETAKRYVPGRTNRLGD